eukprot:5595784-Alexandrium_andersonii.AAC.1
MVDTCKAVYTPISLLSIDVHKCFDQIPRELGEACAASLGAPEQVLVPCSNFVHSHETMNMVGGRG